MTCTKCVTGITASHGSIEKKSSPRRPIFSWNSRTESNYYGIFIALIEEQKIPVYLVRCKQTRHLKM